MSVHHAHSCTLADLPSGRGLAFARCAPLALADTTRALSGALVIMSMRLFLMLSAMAGTAWGQKTAQETSEKNDIAHISIYWVVTRPRYRAIDAWLYGHLFDPSVKDHYLERGVVLIKNHARMWSSYM